jgi:FMN phosphatase YigB (HAD superfamily)
VKELKKIVCGIDIDGVLAEFPFHRPCERLKLDYFFAYYLRRFRLLNLAFYKLLKVNHKMAEILRKADEYGHKIVAITGHIVSNEKLLKGFLKDNEIPVHELHPMHPIHHRSYFQFKLDKIIETECNLYIEDRADLVKFLATNQARCRIIHFSNDPASFLEIEKSIQMI